jgi:hypothetical protein
MVANKLLMFDKVEKACNLHSQVDFEGLFHMTTTTTTTTNTYMDIVLRDLVGIGWFTINAKSCKCVLCWWQKEEHKFSTIVI